MLRIAPFLAGALAVTCASVPSPSSSPASPIQQSPAAIATAPSELVIALTQVRPEAAEQFQPADPAQAFARDFVLEVLPAAKPLRIAFSTDGAQRLLTYLTSESVAAGIKTLPHPSDAQVSADRRRLVALLLAHATSDSSGRLVITPTSIAAFRDTILLAGIRKWLCPIWPFCRVPQ